MRLPRWTAYLAMAVLAIFLFTAIPKGEGPRPSEGAAEALRNGEATATTYPRLVVLGIDVRPGLAPDDLKRLIYTAATRARSKLVVVADPDQLRMAELYILAGLFKSS